MSISLLFSILFTGAFQPKLGLLWLAHIWGAVRAGSDPFYPWTHLSTGPPYAAWKPSPLPCHVPTILPCWRVWLLSNQPFPSAQSLVVVSTGPLECSLPRTNGPRSQTMGTGAFLDSDAARCGPLDLRPQGSLDTSPSIDFCCHHSPLWARGPCPPQTLKAL